MSSTGRGRRGPLDLVRDAGQTLLVLEDAGGEPLDRLLGAPMELGRFLRLAVGIAVALGKLHQRGFVHKDIKPANILVNGATGEVRLTGFGIASRLSRERQSPHPPETIAGALAYMAPEQDWPDESDLYPRETPGRILRWYVLLTNIEDRTQALAWSQQMQSDFAPHESCEHDGRIGRLALS